MSGDEGGVMRYAMVLLAALIIAAAPGDKSRPARPVDSPAQWFGPAAYPPAALRAGQEGRAAVRLTVDPTGHPTECEVASSSGSAVLDDETCSIAMAHMQFTPAKNAHGRTITGSYPLAVHWKLPAPTDATPEAGPQGCTFAGGDMDAREKERACRAILQSLGTPAATPMRGSDQSGTAPR